MNWLVHEKLKLRSIESNDIDKLLEWENNRENWEISGTLTPFSREVIQRYAENAHLSIFEAGQYRFIIELTNGQAVGCIDLFDFDPFHKRVGIGILIGSSGDRGKGFAGIAINLIKDYCFKYLDLHQIYCNILSENVGSVALFSKAGFKLAGTKKDWVRRGKEFKDELFLQLIR